MIAPDLILNKVGIIIKQTQIVHHMYIYYFINKILVKKLKKNWNNIGIVFHVA